MFIYRKYLIEQLIKKKSFADGQGSSLIDRNPHSLTALKISS